MLHEFRFVKCVLELVGFGWGDRAVHDLPADTDQRVGLSSHTPPSRDVAQSAVPTMTCTTVPSSSTCAAYMFTVGNG
jgi:hypothetical protein